jgi:chemotaxis protein methyltransferase CheR
LPRKHSHGAAVTALPLAPSEFDAICKLAHRAFGLDLKPGKEDLVAARLRSLLRTSGHGTFHAYYRSIVEDSTGESLAAMIDALATNHTSFLREPGHFEYLRRQVLPELATRDTIEIWSAACSTGEEAWSLAMLLHESSPSRRFRLCASDISSKALAFARHAVYSRERCRGIPPHWLARYFRAEGDPPDYSVVSSLRAPVDYFRINLVEPFSWPRQFPVIFCRNVMIYFDRATQERVVRRLAECLEPGGYLFVGHAEGLAGVSHPLEYVKPAIYRKPG